MLQTLSALSPPVLALLASAVTFGITALGSLTVFLLPRRRAGQQRLLPAAAAGVMLAASYWSLLAPAIDGAAGAGRLPGWFVAAAGFLLGGAFLAGGEALARRLEKARGAELSDSARRCRLLMVSITLHNIPEGLAIGVAFGRLAHGASAAALAAACSVALGIGLQNFPEGAAVALPLLHEGCSPGRAFFLGQLSGLAEPVSAVAGALLAAGVARLLPWALAGAAGAMVYVAVHELIPSAQRPPRPRTTLACLAGFAVMMVLDVALG